MWSLILYFLFGIIQPSSSLPNGGTPTTQTANTTSADDDGDNGGETSTPRPPKNN